MADVSSPLAFATMISRFRAACSSADATPSSGTTEFGGTHLTTLVEASSTAAAWILNGMARARRSNRPFVEELPKLLDKRQISIRALSRDADVDPAHLSRVLRGAGGKTASSDLVQRVTAALDLPADYFPEMREAEVIDRVRSDARLRDRVYDSLSRRKR